MEEVQPRAPKVAVSKDDITRRLTLLGLTVDSVVDDGERVVIMARRTDEAREFPPETRQVEVEEHDVVVDLHDPQQRKQFEAGIVPGLTGIGGWRNQ